MVRYKGFATSAVVAILVTCALMGAAWATAQTSHAATTANRSLLILSPQWRGALPATTPFLKTARRAD